MNLIEKLGLEKCKAIVDGAPEWVTHYWGSIKGEYAQKSHITHCSSILGDEGGSSTKVYKNETWTTYHSSGYPNLIDLNDLRTAIANHERTDTCTDIRNHISPLTGVIER